MEFKEHLKKYLEDEEIEKLTKSLLKERTNCLILNTNKVNEENFIKEFSSIEKFEYINHAYYYDKNINEMGKSYLFDNGAYYIMDASSMLVSNNLILKDNSLVLDMCAAPGGKTISLALKYPKVNILSNDLSYPRALTMSSNIEKLGLSNITIISNDFSKNYKQFLEKFDAIILDAPCSGSAMFRKLEEMKNDWTYQKVLKQQTIQKELIEIAYQMLKKGGQLVYSTCSFSYEEDEEIVLDLLNNHSDIHPILLNDYKEIYHDKSLKEGCHIFPHRFKGEGQFYCLLKKDGDLIANSINQTKFKPNKVVQNVIDEYNLDFLNYEIIDNNLYGFNYDFSLKHIPTIRKGINIGEFNKDIFKPSFNLAHYKDSSTSILLTKEEKEKYLHGDTFNKIINLKNGYYIVSYNNLNLGYVKNVNGLLKNLYPKGLRH